MKIKKTLLTILIMMLIVFTGCENIPSSLENKDTINPTVYSIDSSLLKDENEISKFDLSDIKILITVGNGSSVTVDVTEDMVSQEDLEKLSTIGTHNIHIKYKSLDAAINITIIEDSEIIETTYRIDASNLEKETVINSFKLSNIFVVITHDNGDEESVPVTAQMLSQEDISKLSKEGTHLITINYLDFSETIEIKLIKNILPEIPSDAKTILEILSVQVTQGEITTEKYKVCGVVESLENNEYGNMYISDNTGRILIYGMYDSDNNLYRDMEDKPVVGDSIVVEGAIKNYNGEYELLNVKLISLTKGSNDENDDDERGDQNYVDEAGYYKAAQGLEGTALKTKLRQIISANYKGVSYTSLNTYLQKTDASPNDPNKILLFYTRKEINKAWDSGKTWNKEHVWPRSKGWFGYEAAGCDAHHIRAVDSGENSSRGNKPYGTGSGYYLPTDEVKGDVARIIFYLLVRYSESDSYKITNVAKSMDMLLEWNELDPVDDIERKRNEEVYKIQNNRNPFIDNSDYAYYIWDTSYLTKTNSSNDETIKYEVIQIYCVIENKKGRKGLFVF